MKIKLCLLTVVLFALLAGNIFQVNADSNVDETKIMLSTQTSYITNLMSYEMDLWADQHGDLKITHVFTVDSPTASVDSFYWWFAESVDAETASDFYKNIAAFDESGPLRIDVTYYDDYVGIKVHTRHVVQYGETYSYTLSTWYKYANSFDGVNGSTTWALSTGTPREHIRFQANFPSSAVQTWVMPDPTETGGNYLAWDRWNPEPGTPMDILVYYTVPPSMAVPLIKQYSLPWGPELYAYSNETIGELGCNLTSMVMLINYYAEVQYSQFRTDPFWLNDELLNRGGYTLNNGVTYSVVAEYARDWGLRFYFDGKYGRDDELLDYYIMSGRPVVVGVNGEYVQREDGTWYYEAGHFVVVTGKTSVNGVDTWLINDPGFDKTTLLDWDNEYGSIIAFSDTSKYATALQITMQQPTEFVITDPDGNRLGYDIETQTYYNEIPSSSYVYEGIRPLAEAELRDEQVVATIMYPEGDYTINISSLSAESYVMDMNGVNWAGSTNSIEVNGNITPGEEESIIVKFDPVLGVNRPLYLPIIVK